MRRIHLLLYIILASISLLSCENFRDNNGDLGGAWQLVEWKTRSTSGQIDSIVANNIYNDTTVPNKNKLYYCIHRNDLQIRLGDAVNTWTLSYFCTISVTDKVIQLGQIVDDYDSTYTYSKVRDLGIPSNGRFDIQFLDKEKLTLGSDNDILKFRKY